MSITPQATLLRRTAMSFTVRNQGSRVWFEYEIDLMARKGNPLKTLSEDITKRRNEFMFLVFREIEEKTNSWLKVNAGFRHRAYIEDVRDQAHYLREEIRKKHRYISDKRAIQHESRVPGIRVSVGQNLVRVTSDGWLDAVVSVFKVPTHVDGLRNKIKEGFDTFYHMLVCKLEREIRNMLLDVEKAFFRDRGLIAVKTDFDERMTVPLFELKKWIERVSAKTIPGGKPNPDYIPGMDVLAGWDLTTPGRRVQARVVRMFHEGSIVRVMGVENQPQPPLGKKSNTEKYDVDICLECDGKEIPVQVGVWEGELAKKISDATVCLGEDIQPNEAVSKFGGTDMDYGIEPDFIELCKKLRQVPPGGVVLWVTAKELMPGSGPIPLKEWYGEILDKKCVIVWVSNENKATIHHNNTGFDLNLARKMCMTLGVTKPNEQMDSEDCRTEGYGPGVEGKLSRLAYKSGYMGRRKPSPVVLANDLVPILRHVVEMYKKSVSENAGDVEKWWRHVSTVLSMLENEADNIKLDSSVWVEMCHILQDVAAVRHAYDDYPCEHLGIDEATCKQHLHALFCLTYVVIYKLRDKTPPEVLETLTAAARLGGQEGMEHRIVLGSALLDGLRWAIPDWYVETEPLLFGKDAPDGMNTVLMRVCSRDSITPSTNTLHPVLDPQTMEKYHAVVLGALGEEMRRVRNQGTETGKLETSDLVRHFMRQVLHGSRGYGVVESVRDLSCIGPDAVSVAGRECWFLIQDENTDKEVINRCIQFWKAVLDSSPEPESLHGFGLLCSVESIDKDVRDGLMQRTHELSNGMLEIPGWALGRTEPEEGDGPVG